MRALSCPTQTRRHLYANWRRRSLRHQHTNEWPLSAPRVCLYVSFYVLPRSRPATQTPTSAAAIQLNSNKATCKDLQPRQQRLMWPPDSGAHSAPPPINRMHPYRIPVHRHHQHYPPALASGVAVSCAHNCPCAVPMSGLGNWNPMQTAANYGATQFVYLPITLPTPGLQPNIAQLSAMWPTEIPATDYTTASQHPTVGLATQSVGNSAPIQTGSSRSRSSRKVCECVRVCLRVCLFKWLQPVI